MPRSVRTFLPAPYMEALAKTVEAKGDAPQWIGHNLKRYAGQRVHFEISPVGDAPFELLQVIDGGTPKQELGEKKSVTRKELHQALDDLDDGRLEARHVPHIAWLLKLGKVNLPDELLKSWQSALDGLAKEVQDGNHGWRSAGGEAPGWTNTSSRARQPPITWGTRRAKST